MYEKLLKRNGVENALFVQLIKSSYSCLKRTNKNIILKTTPQRQEGKKDPWQPINKKTKNKHNKAES